MQKSELLNFSTQIVSAYVSKNAMTPDQVVTFLGQITSKLMDLSGEHPPLQPPVPIKESYTDEYIICLEDGKKVTLLKRYLANHFDMTVEEYIEKWGLPEDYPSVTKSYSEKRSKIAKDQGLGKSA
jgi:predicted transcriptional regulator